MPEPRKYVQCMSGLEEGDAPHTVHRAVCLMGLREHCGACPNGQFALRFRLREPDEVVLCPRWASEEDRGRKQDPQGYEPVYRTTCLNSRPFPFCSECPNSLASNKGMKEPKWFELEERRKRIEKELDEEERNG